MGLGEGADFFEISDEELEEKSLQDVIDRIRAGKVFRAESSLPSNSEDDEDPLCHVCTKNIAVAACEDCNFKFLCSDCLHSHPSSHIIKDF